MRKLINNFKEACVISSEYTYFWRARNMKLIYTKARMLHIHTHRGKRSDIEREREKEKEKVRGGIEREKEGGRKLRSSDWRFPFPEPPVRARIEPSGDCEQSRVIRRSKKCVAKPYDSKETPVASKEGFNLYLSPPRHSPCHFPSDALSFSNYPSAIWSSSPIWDAALNENR